MGFAAAAFQFIVSNVAAQTALGAALRFALTTAATTLIAKRFAPGGPGLSSRTITSRGTIEPQAIIYGEALVAASTLAYRKALGNNNSQLWTVHCLAGHEVDSITDIYLDDKQIANSLINGGAAGGGGVTSGTFGPTRGTVNTVEVWKHLGTASQTYDTNLASADTDGEWTSTHRLRGIAYIVTMFKLNDRTEAVWEAGDPSNVKALIRGKKIYDPRLDSTRLIDSTTSPQTYGSGSHRVDTPSTWEWSDNPALCVADYLMDAKFSPLEGGIDPARIDWEAVAAAADDCDVEVVIPPVASPSNTEKRFTCNGVLYGTASGQQNLEALLSSMNGSLVFSGGMYIIRAGVYEAPSDTLSEDDIIGPVGIKSSLSSDERVNSLKAVFIDPDKKYEPTETVLIAPSDLKTTRDGGAELPQSIDLPMTNSWYMAQRIVIKRLSEANQEVTLTVPCNLRAARLVPGERVSLTITERSWAPKVFKVIDWDFYDRGGDQIGVKVTLREDASGAYADPAVSDYNTITNGTLTIADPDIYSSRDTIPRGIRYGEGTWSIQVFENQYPSAGALVSNLGEVGLSAGTFVLPDGTTRSLSAPEGVACPYDSVIKPPGDRFYIIWGATDPASRFPASPTPTFNANGSGLFCAHYDRFNGQWYAVDNSNNETAFTPAATDYVVATGIKENVSGGIDSITAIVAYDENAQVSQRPLSGPNIVNPNFAQPMPGSPRRPAGWWTLSAASETPSYLSGTTDVMVVPNNRTVGSTAFRIDPEKRYRIKVRAKGSVAMAAALDIRVEEYDSELDIAGGEYTIMVSGSTDAPGAVRTRVQTVDANNSLTTSYQTFEAIYVPTSTALWGAISFYDSNVTGEMHISMVELEELLPVTVTVDPPGLIWDTYEAGGWSPADTTRSVTVKFWRGGEEVASRVLDATLTDSGANEGDIAVAAGTSSGEATSVSVSSNNTAAVLATVSHDDSGVVTYVSFGSSLPGYSGGVTK